MKILEINRHVFTVFDNTFKDNNSIINTLIENHGLKNYYNEQNKLHIIHIGCIPLLTIDTRYYIDYTYMNFDIYDNDENNTEIDEIIEYINTHRNQPQIHMVIFIMLNNITDNKDLVLPPALSSSSSLRIP